MDDFALFDDLDPEWAEYHYDRLHLEDWIDRVTTDPPARRTRMMRHWSQGRLQRLFGAFAARLWPGQLRGWRVAPCYFIETVTIRGCCLDHEQRVVLDLTRLYSDRQVRGTLLHEMCHAVTPAGHGLRFFQEVERLLTLGLQPAIDFALYVNEPDAEIVRATLPRCALHFAEQKEVSRDTARPGLV